MEPSNDIRYLLDMTFYLSLNLILLNVVFGIIIDTFGEMRADRDARFKDTTETCFICSIEKQVFDRESDLPEGFKRHIKNEQNMWNYLYFIIYLNEQDKDDDDGLEWYIRRCVEMGDLAWFPIKKAMCLNQSESDDEKLRSSLSDEVVAIEKTLQCDIDLFKDDLRRSIQDIVHTVITTDRTSIGNFDSSSFLGMSDNVAQNAIELTADRNISIKIVKVANLQISIEELKTLSCRLVSEEGMYSVLSTGAVKSEAYFEDSSFLVAQSVSFNVDRTFRIQILKGDSKVGASKFIAIVEVSMRTLLASDGLDIELPFYLAEQEDAAILLLRSNCNFSELAGEIAD